MILKAEGAKQASVLEAEGQATAFDLVNQSFVGNAQILKQLEVTENSLDQNSSYFDGEWHQSIADPRCERRSGPTGGGATVVGRGLFMCPRDNTRVC